MHFPTLLLLSASLASAQLNPQQFGPGPAGLEHIPGTNGGSNNDQNQNPGQKYNSNGIGKYGGKYVVKYDDDYADYKDPVSRPLTTFVVQPSQAPLNFHGPVYQAPARYNRNPAHPQAPAHQALAAQKAPIQDYNTPSPYGPGKPQVPPSPFIKQSFSKDEGNSFCMGQCFANKNDAKCSKPYGSGVDIGFNG
ncbi:hypothetical protein N7491_003634 [Penicillium cf. griseofulvum]|uniref:Uncharacterized protein n=1 Tax=Penicillium cf. griseofulvum TaxID=2972120 RepID=A0A9W9MQP1_9EURO|nr:hypothetical protein N7472_002189 [Penicillium cf. griseofulvum]KAJ5441228.1 hypothetical protein N7491_003634 [Penicillium cf. griseofulvum]KAJ5449276.1 hypothetical protein N7445_004097 [Penicillium cf. griseofulvum]